MHTRTSLEPCKTGRRLAPGGRRRNRSPAPAAVTFAVSLSLSGAALAGPTGGSVVSGQGSISTPNTSTTVVNQSSHQLQLNWNTFNVASNESVIYNQPSSSAIAFNRILDQNPSQIFGHVQGNGQVVLVNPNGFLIGRTATLNVNSLVVSSLDAIDFDAASGRYRFSSATNPGAIVNQGSIAAGRGGSVTLLGGSVSNSGNIVADFGTVNLAAGRVATLDLAGDGLLRLEVNSDLLSNRSGAVSAVENSGTISANGGQVVLTANAVKDVFTNLVNNTGVVRANRIDDTGGVIQLLGPGGTVVSSGTLDASAGDSTSSGGSVSVLGERVGLFDNAVVNVSGATNGGTALIGGDEHGANPNILNAQMTYVSPGATINADAGAQGNGGRVIVWSDDTTRFDGQLSARGGSLAGDGGFAEVSGKQNLQFNGGANLTAAHGAWGTLLLDPDQIVIDTSNTDPGNGLDNDSDWKFNEDPGALPAGTVGASVINGLLATGSVTLEAKTKITQNASADITSTTSGSALTLDSKGDIELNAAISLTGADVNVIASNHIDLKGTSSITTTGTGQVTLAAGVSPAFTRTAGTSTITLEDGSKITGGTGLISLHAIDAISLGATGSGTITGGGNVTVQSDNDAVTMVAGSSIASAGSGTISLEGAGPVQVAAISSTGGSVSVTSDTDSISDDGDTNSRIVANSATLTSTATSSAGNIGQVGTPIGTNVNSLTATTSNGSVAVTNLGDLTSATAQASGAGNGINLVTTFASAGSPGNLAILNLSAPGTVTLNAAGTIQNATGSAPVSASHLSMTAGGAIGAGSGAQILTNAGTIDLASTTNGGIYIEDQGHLTLTTATAGGAGNDLVITADTGNMTVGAVSANHTVSLAANNGSIFDDANATTRIVASSAILSSSTSSTADIGQLGDAIGTNVGSLTVQGSNAGHVYVDNLNSLTQIGVGAQAGSLSTASITADNGNITIGNVNAANGVTLTTLAGSILDNGTGLGITSGSLVLSAAQAIGSSANPIRTNGLAVLGATSGANPGPSNPIWITNTGAGQLALSGITASGPGNDITISATGNQLVNAGTTRGGALSLTAAAIGAAGTGNLLPTQVSSVNATASSGGVFVANQGDLGTLTAAATGGAVDITNQGNVATATIQATGGSNGIDLTTTAGGTAGNLAVKTLSAPGTVTLNAAGTIQNAPSSTLVSASDLGMTAGGAIGGPAAGSQIVTNAGTIDLATTTSGGIYIEDQAPFTLTAATAGGAGNDVVVTGDSGNMIVGTVSALHSVSLTAGTGGALVDDGDNTTKITTPTLTLSGTAVGATGGTGQIDTATSSLTATASNGGVFVGNTGDLTVNQAHATGAGSGITISTVASISPATPGNLSIKDIDSPGTVTLNAAGTIQNAFGSIPLVASHLSMTAGGAIGGAGAQIVTNAGTIDLATTTNGGIYIEDQSAATLTTVTAGGAGNDFVFTGDGVTTTVGTLSANHAVTLNTLGALNDDGNNATKITTGTLTLGIGTSIGAATASGEIDTAASTINATAANGSIFLSNQGDLTSVTAHATGGSNGISLTTTAGGSAGNLGVKDINAPGTVILNAAGTIQDAFGSIPLAASHLSMTAGGAIGGTSGAQIVTSTPNIDLAATTNGGIYIEDQAPFTLTTATAGGAGNDVVVTGDSGAMTVGTVSAGHAVTLTAATALNDDGNDATRISTNLLTLIAGSSIGATGTHNEIDTSASFITATGNNGGVYIGDAGTAGGLTLSNVRSLNTGDVVVASGGDITAGTVSSLNQVTLSSGGSLFGSGPAISGPNGVTLSAANAIGQVTTFSSLSGTPVSLTSNGPVSASVSNSAGQINLDISGAPTFAANSISLGGGAASAGTVVLQSANSLNVGALSAGAIQLGNGNTSSLGLSSGNILTLPSSIVVTDYAPSTLLVRGTADVVDSANTRTFAFNATALNFQSGAQGGATTLNTAVGTLDATVGNGQSLTVHETGSMTVGSVSAGNVAIDATGALTDDSNNATRIVGNNVTLSGSALGASGTNNELDTQAGVLNATSTAGGIYIGEADGATLTGSATGGPLVVQAGGTLAVAGASGTNVTLSTTGAASDLIVTGAINGNGGPVNLQTAGANSAISVAADITTTGDVGLTAGPSGTRGAIFQTAGLITGHNLAAVGSSVGNSGAALNTSVSSLSATAEAGSVYITQSGDLASLTASAAGGGVVNVATTGAMTVGSASGTAVTLAASGNGAALTLAGPVDGGAGLVSLTADGAINSNGAQITAGSLIASGASVGANGSPLNTTIPVIGATATNGGVYIQNTGNLTLSASATGGGVQVAANGGLTAGNVSGTGVNLTASGTSSPLILNGVVNSGTGDLTLTAGSAVVADPASFVSGANAVVRGVQVGTSTGRLNTAVNSLDVATTNGDIYVNEADGMALTAAATNGTLDVKAGGAIVGSTAGRVSAGTVTLSGTAIGASGTPVNTTATTLNATSSLGGIFLNEQDAASLTASATGGPVNVQAGGVLTVASVTGDGATLTTTGSGSNINLNGAVNGGSGAVALNAAGALVNGAGSQVTGGALTVTGTVIASSANPLATTVSSLTATSTAGGIYVNEADGLTLTASATGGSVNVQTANGALVVSGATGNSISLVAGGAGNGLTVNGAVSAGSGDVTLTAGTTSSPGAVAAGAGNSVAGGTLTVTGSSIGSSSTALNTRITTLKANATQGGVYFNEQDGLTLADVRAGSDVSVSSAAGDIAVQSITASNNVSLMAGSGAIADDGDNTTVISGKGVTLLAKSIGAPSTLTASVLDSKLRLDIQANTLEATSTNGGIYIDALNGLASASVHASGGTVGNIELLAPTGDLNLLKVSASNTLLLAAGGNIIGLPGLGTITARSAELRAGGSSATAGRIGSLAQPLSLQLDPGNTLHIYVPASLNTNDATLAPSTLPSAGVTTTLSTFNAPDALSVQAGFGQFQGLSDTLFTSPAEALVRSIQNQTATVQSVVGIDWASFNPNVSLFGTLDPSVCLPGDQRDEEKGGGGC